MTNPTSPSRADIDYELLSHIAHEARGPYNGLIGFSDLLDSHFDNLPVERQKEYAHYVKLLASKSFFQLQTFIAWIKLISNNFKINHSPFFVSDAVKSALQYNANDITSKSIEVIAPTNDSGRINGDQNYINIALANIILFALQNCVKHSHLELHIETKAEQTLLKISYHTTADNAEATQLLTFTGNNPEKVPESKTGLWVAGQIIKHHGLTMTVETLPENRINIGIHFGAIS